MTFPEAEILSFDDPKLGCVTLEDTAHFRVTSRMLQDRVLLEGAAREERDSHSSLKCYIVAQSIVGYSISSRD